MSSEDLIVDLEVAKAYSNDSGRGIARLDPDTFLHLKLSPGDIIRITGGKQTAAKVWRAGGRKKRNKLNSFFTGK